ncbi:hypothetical protein FDK33_15815 [Citrobacter werkmanii]|nr:hypothetical protein [Citrobacter werkmanii]MBQ4937358.1 hypothetical protein [Citrobacter werkmanii]MBQ4950071.1 hypothetical protein [Citrobacter werkmanii]MBQ4965895.1 hypothetical protein [Citrobacter werkmanii]HCT9709937.1 phage holin family protein [Citrobacter werkmanii]
MNDKKPEFWAVVLTGLKNAWPQILGALIAGFIAYGRLIHSHPDGLSVFSAVDQRLQIQSGLSWCLFYDDRIYTFRCMPLLSGRYLI